MKNISKMCLLALGILGASNVQAKDICTDAASACVMHQFSGVPLKPLQTMSWVVNCSRDYPFYYKYENTSVKEVSVLEGSLPDGNTMVFNITNWSLGNNTLSVRYSCTKEMNQNHWHSGCPVIP